MDIIQFNRRYLPSRVVTKGKSNVYSSTMTVWGVVGPARVFYPSGLYSKLHLFFILVAVGRIVLWILRRRFKKDWIKLIVFLNILFGALPAPPATPMHCWSWFAIGILFNYFVYRGIKGGGLSITNFVPWTGYAGVAAMALLTNVAVQMKGLNGPNWWGLELDDHCALAHCPTSPDATVEGCPTFH